MKKYRVEYEKTARKAINNLDSTIRKRIMDYINTNLVDCENPRFRGKNLVKHPKGNWRYRVGDYRIVVDIQDEKIVILVVDVDKRNDVYK